MTKALRIIQYTKDRPKAMDWFAAQIIIDPNGNVVKDVRGLRKPREATDEELANAIIIERESAWIKIKESR